MILFAGERPFAADIKHLDPKSFPFVLNLSQKVTPDSTGSNMVHQSTAVDTESHNSNISSTTTDENIG